MIHSQGYFVCFFNKHDLLVLDPQFPRDSYSQLHRSVDELDLLLTITDKNVHCIKNLHNTPTK